MIKRLTGNTKENSINNDRFDMLEGRENSGKKEKARRDTAHIICLVTETDQELRDNASDKKSDAPWFFSHM